MSGSDLRTDADSAATYGGPDQIGDEMLADLLDAVDHHIAPEEYLSLRALGGDHAGIVKLTGRRCRAGTIANALRAGATCAEVNEVGTPWTRLNSYLPMRRAGQSHRSALTAMTEVGVNGTDYDSCIEAGATHSEILEIAAVTRSQYDYAKCRGMGISHADVMRAVEAGISPYALWFAGHREVCVDELISVVTERGANPMAYIESHNVTTSGA